MDWILYMLVLNLAPFTVSVRSFPGQEKQHHPSDAPMPWNAMAPDGFPVGPSILLVAEEAKSDGGVYNFTIQYSI